MPLIVLDYRPQFVRMSSCDVLESPAQPTNKERINDNRNSDKKRHIQPTMDIVTLECPCEVRQLRHADPRSLSLIHMLPLHIRRRNVIDCKLAAAANSK